MSFRGQLLRSGIDSDGKIVTIYKNDGRLDVLTASTETSGTIRSAKITHTVSANSMSLINETLRVSLESEYYTGDWSNAIVGRIDYGDTGDARGGMAAAICAEMNMPAKSYASIGGPCYSLDCEFNCPTSFVAGERATYPIAFLKFGLWGGAKGEFDDEGYLFHTDGLTAGSGHVLSANSRTLRVNIGGTDKYIYLSDTEDDLGSAYVDTLSVTPATAVNAISVTAYTPSADGSNGAAVLRAGTYGSPLTESTNYQGGILRLYLETSGASSYNKGVFSCLKTTGVKGIHAVCGLVEVLAQAGAGPTSVYAAQFVAHLNSATAKIASSGALPEFIGVWAKITANEGAQIAASTISAPLWVDNQLYGSGPFSGEEYTIFATTGGTVPDAFIGFQTTSSGWANFLYFDETSYDQDPVVASGCNVSGAGASEAYLRVSLNGTEYGIPLIAI